MRKLTRAKLEQLVEDLLDRSLEPCKKALADAGMTASKIDEVVLVGGQTRMPKIQEIVKKMFGREPNREREPGRSGGDWRGSAGRRAWPAK